MAMNLEQRTAPVLLHVTTEIEPEWDEDVNRWYNEEHIPELMAVPGFISARRYTLAGGDRRRRPQKYLCIYEIANEHVVLDRSYLTYHTGWRGQPSLRTAWTDRSSQHYRTHRSVLRQAFPIHGCYEDRSGDAGREPMPAVGTNLDDLWRQPIGAALYHVLFTPDPEWEDEIVSWYDRVQVPTLMNCPGFLSARRFMLRYDEDRGDPSVIGHHKYLCLYQVRDESVTVSEDFVIATKQLTASRRELDGGEFTVASTYVQSYPASGPYESHAGVPIGERRTI